MKVYLDNCSYNRPFDDQSQMRIYLETQSKPLDYIKWQKEHYADMSVSEINRRAVEYAKNAP